MGSLPETVDFRLLNTLEQMKKLIIVISIIFSVLDANGQFIDNVNLYSGISISKVDWTIFGNNIDTSPSVGYSTGFKIGFLNEKYYSLNSKIGMNQISIAQKVPFLDINGNIVDYSTDRYDFNYLTLNISARIKLLRNNFEPFVSVGSRIDYLVSYTKFRDKVRKIDYGMGFGLGLNYFLKTNVILSVEFGYEIRVNEISENIIPNNNFLVEFGFGFKINNNDQ